MKTDTVTTLDTTVDPVDSMSNGNGSHGKGDSLLDELRARRKSFFEGRDYVELPIPGYGGQMVARYRRIEWEVVNELVNRAQADASPRADLEAAADLLVRACEGIMVREEGSDGLVPLNRRVAEFGDEPVRYDIRLAETFKLDPLKIGGESPRARLIIQEVIPDDFALMAHQAKFVEWLAGVSGEASADF